MTSRNWTDSSRKIERDSARRVRSARRSIQIGQNSLRSMAVLVAKYADYGQNYVVDSSVQLLAFLLKVATQIKLKIKCRKYEICLHYRVQLLNCLRLTQEVADITFDFYHATVKSKTERS